MFLKELEQIMEKIKCKGNRCCYIKSDNTHSIILDKGNDKISKIEYKVVSPSRMYGRITTKNISYDKYINGGI